MTFTADIPMPGQKLGSSRTQVLGNFSNYNTVMSVNHIAPNSTGQGKHKFVEMPVPAVIPSTLVNEGGIFTQSVGGVTLPFYQRDGNTTVNQPALPMAQAVFITANTPGPVTIVNQYNINSIVYNSTGSYTITMSYNLPFTPGSKEYGVLTNWIFISGPALIAVPANLATNSFRISTLFPGATVPSDSPGNRIAFTVIQ